MSNHIHTSSMSTPAPGALATALPSNAELAHDLREENRRLKQDCANLLRSCKVVEQMLRLNGFTGSAEYLAAAIKGAEIK